MENLKKQILITGLLLLFGMGVQGQEWDVYKHNARSGVSALNYGVTGYYNLTYGSWSLQYITSGTSNVAIGTSALNNLTTGSQNVALGSSALIANITGSNNTAIGHYSGVDANNPSLTNTTAIGFNARVYESNSIQLGNADVTKVKAGGDSTTFYAAAIQAKAGITAGDRIIASSGITVNGTEITANAGITAKGSIKLISSAVSGNTLVNIDNIGNITASSFIRSGGTSSQYLMADGTVSTGVLPLWATSGSGAITYNAGDVKIGNTASPAVKLEVGTDNRDTQTEYLKVHGSATFNNDTNTKDLTQVSINTNVKLSGIALTVGGPTFIGSWKDVEDGTNRVTADVLNPEANKLYNLFVTKGITTESFLQRPNADWKDVVFSNDYHLLTLSEVDLFIQKNKHLPGILSGEEVRTKGYDMHDMNQAFLEKIENLYLYSISQEKEIKELKEQITEMDELKAILKTVQAKLEKLEQQK